MSKVDISLAAVVIGSAALLRHRYLQWGATPQEQLVVVRGGVPMGKVAAPYDFTWAFVLIPKNDGTTRLVVRERYAYSRRWSGMIVQPAARANCVMTPKMLRGIKSRAEN